MSDMVLVRSLGREMTRREFDRVRAELAAYNRRWPTTLVDLPQHLWPADFTRTKGAAPRRAFRSATFIVAVFQEGPHVRLSVNRTRLNDVGEFDDGIAWDELQRVKAEAGFGDRWAVEIYPASDEVVNVANMRHLWLLDTAPPMAWRSRTLTADEVRA